MEVKNRPPSAVWKDLRNFPLYLNLPSVVNLKRRWSTMVLEAHECIHTHTRMYVYKLKILVFVLRNIED